MISADDLLAARIIHRQRPELQPRLVEAMAALAEAEEGGARATRTLLGDLLDAQVVTREQAEFVHRLGQRYKQGQALGLFLHLAAGETGQGAEALQERVTRLGDGATAAALAEDLVAGGLLDEEAARRLQFQAKLAFDQDRAAQVAAYTQRSAAETAQTLVAGAAVDEESALAPALGRYRVEGVLGQGSFGTVYAAFDEELKRPVAIKALSRLEGTAAARFLREAKLIAGFQHPHLVKLHETVNQGERLLLVQERIAGPSLEQVSPLPARDAAEVVLPIARAAAYAHEQGVVHRDIKPDNVLLGEGRPRLIDFGIALEEEGERLTQTGKAVATPMFAPPEQLSGKRVDARADVYALGATLYYALTGRAPFTTMIEVFRADAEPPSRVVKGVPRALDAICARALAKRPEGRYPSAAALADDLEAFLAGSWRPAPSALWKLWPAVALVAVVVALVGLARGDDPAGAGAASAPPPPPSPAPLASPQASADPDAVARALAEGRRAAEAMRSYRAPLTAFARARRAAAGDAGLTARVDEAELHYLLRRGRFVEVTRRAVDPKRATPAAQVFVALAWEAQAGRTGSQTVRRRARRQLRALAAGAPSSAWAGVAEALSLARRVQAKACVARARRAVAEAGEEDRLPLAYARYAEGRGWLALGKPRRAAGPLRQACDEVPDHALFQAARGEALRDPDPVRPQKRREALRAFDLAVRLSEPDPDPRALRQLGLLSAELKAPEKRALAWLERVLAGSAGDAEALFWRGVVKYRLRRQQGGGAGGAQAFLEDPKAEVDWRRAFQLAPQAFGAWQLKLPVAERRDVGAAVGR